MEFCDSLAYQILSRLSHSLSRLPYPSGQQPDTFDDHRRDAEAAPTLLEDIFRLSREGHLDGAETGGKSLASDRIQLKRHPRAILHEARNLRERIGPGSNVHPGVDLEGGWDGERHLGPVRIAVTEVRDLLERLEDPEAPTNEFELAWNGIMPSRIRERKRQRL